MILSGLPLDALTPFPVLGVGASARIICAKGIVSWELPDGWHAVVLERRKRRILYRPAAGLMAIPYYRQPGI